MPDKWGVNTDERDKETRDAMDEFVKAEQARDWSYDKLQEYYANLRTVAQENLPDIWPGLEFALSVKTILNIKDCNLPFAGILLGPASSMKTAIIELFRDSHNTYYTDNFSPRALVSHISGKSEEELRKSDLLPKLINKLFMTPELAPVFSARDDDLLQLIGIMTRVLDGKGYESDSGAQGHRGYHQEMMFTWIGASIDISPKVYRLLSTLGPKLYFYRLDRIEVDEDTYFLRRKHDFKVNYEKIRIALLEYLTYFDMNPDAEILQNPKDSEDESGLRKVQLDPDNDEELAHRIIIRISLVLARLRALVPTWETYGTQGSDYGYRIAQIETPDRAMERLTDLARGHALSQGRRYITLEDIPTVIHMALSTASMERVRMFELLIAHNGTLDTNTICDSLNVSEPTARRTMTELKATGLVSMQIGQSHASSTITLDPKYDWFVSYEFSKLKEGKLDQLLKEKYPPEGGPISLTIGAFLYDSIINKKILSNVPTDNLLSGGKNSFRSLTDKPLEQWGNIDFVLNACIYCLNNGGYRGAPLETTDEYERHIVMKHKDRPAYPGPADIEKYGLKYPVSSSEPREWLLDK